MLKRQYIVTTFQELGHNNHYINRDLSTKFQAQAISRMKENLKYSLFGQLLQATMSCFISAQLLFHGARARTGPPLFCLPSIFLPQT